MYYGYLVTSNEVYADYEHGKSSTVPDSQRLAFAAALLILPENLHIRV
jgi:hypothetical protein